jgi:hypothetical protein
MGRAKLRGKHTKFAASTRFEESESFFQGKTGEELVELAWGEFKKKGYKIVHRPRSKTYTTTGLFRLYLGHGYDDKDPIEQAALLWHEHVHAEQWRRLGLVFAARYLNAKWRWAYEVQGYRQQYRIYRAFGLSDSKVSKMILRLPGHFQGDLYKMGRLKTSQLKTETIKAMENGLEDFRVKA